MFIALRLGYDFYAQCGHNLYGQRVLLGVVEKTRISMISTVDQ